MECTRHRHVEAPPVLPGPPIATCRALQLDLQCRGRDHKEWAGRVAVAAREAATRVLRPCSGGPPGLLLLLDAGDVALHGGIAAPGAQHVRQRLRLGVHQLLQRGEKLGLT